jgi:hypothetical protein
MKELVQKGVQLQGSVGTDKVIQDVEFWERLQGPVTIVNVRRYARLSNHSG